MAAETEKQRRRATINAHKFLKIEESTASAELIYGVKPVPQKYRGRFNESSVEHMLSQ